MTDLEKERREVVLRNTKTLAQEYKKIMYELDEETFKNYSKRIIRLLDDLYHFAKFGEYPF